MRCDSIRWKNSILSVEKIHYDCTLNFESCLCLHCDFLRRVSILNRVYKVCIQLNYLLTYLLTPWCRVLLEKLTDLQLVKKFPAFHGTRRFITALTSVRHLSLSWASPVQSIYPHPTSCRSILILSTHLRLGLPSGLFQEHQKIEEQSVLQ